MTAVAVPRHTDTPDKTKPARHSTPQRLNGKP
jgi:hypothetical protein